MKKFLTVFIAILMAITLPVCGAGTDFLTEFYPNYTGECSYKISFDNADEIAKLIKEIDYSGQIENFVDIKSILESLLSLDSKMTVQIDVSEDMKKMQASIIADSSHYVKVNSNLSLNAESKTGIWMSIDFSDSEKPIYQIIYSLPFMNKYVVIDMFEMMPVDEAEGFIYMMEMLLNREFMMATNTFAAEVIKKYADIKVSYGKCIIDIDNDALINIIEDMLPYIAKLSSDAIQAFGEETVAEQIRFEDMDLSNIKLLGNKGIKYTYLLKNGKISSVETDMDISIDIGKMYSLLTGYEWNSESKGLIEFTMEMTQKMTKVGSTKVSFPTLTDENSIRMADMINDTAIPEEEFEQTYPSWYVSGSTNRIPVIDGEIYVPLRHTIEEAYKETVAINFENGKIVIKSENFPGFKTISLSDGSDRVYTENGEFITKPVFIENGVTYVGSSLFTELFGWTFESAYHDMLSGEYSYGFFTEAW